jgi:hypothetical protein
MAKLTMESFRFNRLRSRDNQRLAPPLRFDPRQLGHGAFLGDAVNA